MPKGFILLPDSLHNRVYENDIAEFTEENNLNKFKIVKMIKSVKNYVSIENFIEKNTEDGVDPSLLFYNAKTMDEVESNLKKIYQNSKEKFISLEFVE